MCVRGVRGEGVGEKSRLRQETCMSYTVCVTSFYSNAHVMLVVCVIFGFVYCL